MKIVTGENDICKTCKYKNPLISFITGIPPSEGDCPVLQGDIFCDDTVNISDCKCYIEKISKQKPIDYQSVIDEFNSVCSSLSKVRLISDTRKAAIRNRKKDLDNLNMSFKEYFEIVKSRDFLNGDNGRGWKADFDWIMKSQNFIKIVEGTYKNSKPKDKLQSKPSYDLDEIKRRMMNNTEI